MSASLGILALLFGQLWPFPGPGRAAVGSSATLVQTETGSASIDGSGVASITVSSTASGHLLVLYLVNNSTASDATIADNQSQTWSYPFSPGQRCWQTQYTSTFCAVGYVANSASGVTTLTVTITGTAFGSLGYIFREYAGVATASALDVSHPTGTGTMATFASTSWTSTAVTTTATDLLIGIASSAGAATWTATGSWTGGVAISSGAYTAWAFMEDQLSAAAGSKSAAGTVDAGTGGSGILAFKLQ